ncbi:MAG TPA: flagellar hook-basal body complex protein FliE [Ilumatobacteraceae bacterium]|nr:flagellar hook-basal body complex protein FliE [Ilumatobacteraceae bacterium]
MAILSIPPISVSGLLQAGNMTGAAGAAGAGAASGVDFANSLTSALDELAKVHQVADDLSLQAATGDLQAVQDMVIATTEAQLMTELVVNVRNKAVEAFNDIMRMQV